MTRPAILIIPRSLGRLTPMLEGQCDVHLVWEGLPAQAEAAIVAMVLTGAETLDKALVERLPNLKLIACFAAGYDGIDVDWCRARGLEVTHAPGVNSEDVADHAIGLILAARRQIVRGDRELRGGLWTAGSKLITPSLGDQRLGIVGLGGIGEAVARRAEAMRMTVQWWGPRKKASAWPRADSLMTLARDSDILVVACRADDTNIGLISAEVLAALGPQGLLVNVARGQLVDEAALIDALKSSTLGQAALDVFAHEPVDHGRWIDVPNTVLTPHTAGATTQAVQGMVMLLVQNLTALFAGEPLKTPVP